MLLCSGQTDWKSCFKFTGVMQSCSNKWRTCENLSIQFFYLILAGGSPEMPQGRFRDRRSVLRCRCRCVGRVGPGRPVPPLRPDHGVDGVDTPSVAVGWRSRGSRPQRRLPAPSGRRPSLDGWLGRSTRLVLYSIHYFIHVIRSSWYQNNV